MVSDFTEIFRGARTFNQPLENWDLGSATTLISIFSDADAFNQPIGNWDVSSVTNMFGAFSGATSFNREITGWNVSNVSFMNRMFFNTPSFNQDLSSWCVSQITSLPDQFAEASALTQANFPVWGTCPDPVSNEILEELPSDFKLHQNFPNPFNPSTNIQFDLTEAGLVKLAVYNMLGQEVAVLVDEFRNIGTHTVTFDAANLSSGLYFYQITTQQQKIGRAHV